MNATLQRYASISYTLVDEVHSLVDADAGLPPAYHGSSRGRLDPLRKKVAVCGLILFGTLISTLGKLAYQVQSVGRDGALKPFEKPWFMVLLMFAGMGLNLPLSLFLDLVRLSRRRVKALVAPDGYTTPQQQQQQLYAPLLRYDQYDDEVPVFESLPPVWVDASGSITAQQYWQHHFRRLFHKQLLLLLLPTLFDLLGGALLNIGLLSVTASATQMMRQSLLPCAALLGVGLWRKRLNALHAAGLTGCMAGLGMVAAASLASGYGGSASTAAASDSRSAMAVGIVMILLSQVVAAGQLLIDQSSWNARLQLSPLKVVGCEGLLGMMITLFVVLPLADISSVGREGRGLSEDTWDSLLLIINRPLLQVLLLVYTGSLQAYNIAGMVTAGELSAVDMTLLQAVRTLFVWIVNLLVYAVAAALTPDRTDQQQQQEQQQQQQGRKEAEPAAGPAAIAGAALQDNVLAAAAAVSESRRKASGAALVDVLPVSAAAEVPLNGRANLGQHQEQQQQQQYAPAGVIEQLQATAPDRHQAMQQQQQQQQQHLLQFNQHQQHQQPADVLQQQGRSQAAVDPQQQRQLTGRALGDPGSSSSSKSRRYRATRRRARLKQQQQELQDSDSAVHQPVEQMSQPQQPYVTSTLAGAVPAAAAAQASAAAAATAAAGVGLLWRATAAAVQTGSTLAAAAAGASGTLLQLPPAVNASSTAAAAAAAAGEPAAAITAVVAGLPGEPWLPWSFLQAAGFLVLIAAALTYSRGDHERWRRQLEAEAALIFADMPPGGGSRAASISASMAGSYRPFTANMDIDSAAFLRSSQRPFGRTPRDAVYGVTPVSHTSPLRRYGSNEASLGRSQSSSALVGGSPEEGYDEESLQQQEERQDGPNSHVSGTACA